MNLQQLRYVAEVAQRNLNVSEAARALHTSQSGVSRQISLLESELGVDVFIRQGKRLVAMTRPGEEVVAIARRMLRDIGALRQVGEEYAVGERGRLTIAMTHTQARYVLPRILPEFMRAHPEVKVALHQGIEHSHRRGDAGRVAVEPDALPGDKAGHVEGPQENHIRIRIEIDVLDRLGRQAELPQLLGMPAAQRRDAAPQGTNPGPDPAAAERCRVGS